VELSKSTGRSICVPPNNCSTASKKISGDDGGFKIYGEGLGIGECGGKEQDG